MEFRGHEVIYNRFIKRPVGGTPIDPSLVFGVDTESFHSISLDRLHTQMVLVSHEMFDEVKEPKLGESPFPYLMDDLFDEFSEEESGRLRPGNTKLRRVPGKRGSGRAKLPYILLTFYNLEYDVQRLFNPNSKFFDLARINVEGSKCIVDGYEIENVHMVLSGSAPHFTIILRKNGRILKVFAIDLWGYLKNGLGVSAQALGIVEKLPVDKEYFHIPLEQLTSEQLEELRTYAKRDAFITRKLYLTLLDFLIHFSPNVITKKGILPPSAPAASARIAFGNMETDTLHQAPKRAVEIALGAYNGGLVFSRVRGRVENILVGDRNSAYPTMMTLLPNPEKVTYVHKLSPKIVDLVGKVGFCVADFEIQSTDIPFITSYDGSMRSNHSPGKYHNQPISIYEIAAGYLVGTITKIKIKEAIYLGYDELAIGTGFLHDFIRHMHRVKNENEKGSALYLLAKLLMNALYGKLIEMRNPENMILPAHLRHMRVPVMWALHLETTEGFKERVVASLINGGEGFDEILEEYPFRRKESGVLLADLLSVSTLSAGTYFLPFYASLITAGQRAWMSVYTYYTKAYLADTDSAFSPLSESDFIAALQKADEITTKIGVGRCRIGKELGDIDIELKEGVGYIAGIKQYALDGCGKSKIAHHAIVAPSLGNDGNPYESMGDFYRDTIKKLSRNESVTYFTKPSPVRIRTALARGRDFGRFESGIRVIVPKDDPRMKILSDRNDLCYYGWRDNTEEDETP